MKIFKTVKRLGEWDVTLRTIATTYNTMVEHGYDRETILNEHFYKRYKSLEPKEKFYIVKNQSTKEAVKYYKNNLAYDFTQNFISGNFYSTAQYVTACIFIEYYPDLLFTFGDGSGKPLFHSLVKAKNEQDTERLSEIISGLSIYTIVHQAEPVVRNILNDLDIENKEIIDTRTITSQLERLHSAYRKGDLEKKGVDSNLLSEIILSLMNNGYGVQMFKDEQQVNMLVTKGFGGTNIFGGKLPLRTENFVASLDTKKCKTKSFEKVIAEINDKSHYGKWTYDHIHNIDKDGNELQTFSETIVNYSSEINSFTTGQEFLKELSLRIAEIEYLAPKLYEFKHNKS